jgi:hypothetical protein
MTNARILVASGVVLVLAFAAPAAALAPPVLRVRAVQPVVVDGARFKPLERVTVTLNRLLTQHVRAGTGGTFRATFRGVVISPCNGYSVTAVGSKGSHAALHVRALACPSTNPG